ncbi:MAG: hypothetical protein NTW25_13945 [Candidatus Kapabacteria bacterium]|nr:hypothetical protein [Candidatus Kapabacteria bacterium]
MKIYFDENISPSLAKGLHHLVQPISDGIEVLSLKDVFGLGVADEDWIPQVGKEGGIVITQDYNIYKNVNQRELINQHGVGIFYIKPPSKTGYLYWEMVEFVIINWIKIIKLISNTEKPFAFVCKPRSIQKL